MKYDAYNTLNHYLALKIPTTVKELDVLIHNEDESSYSVANIFPETKVLDLDFAEVETAKSEARYRNSTMDCAFALYEESKIQMLLVEFRFNYSNLRNLNRIKLLNKVSGSIALLGNSIEIFEEYIFIFKPNLKAQAQRRLFMMNPRIPTNYIALDLNDLKLMYF
jgi:hypothetical protein